MATYVIGDIQGCLNDLKCLLKQVDFNWDVDRLWLVGDLINRGPDSLKTLRFLYKHRDSIVAVLGNHDLHALAVANGLRKKSRSDTLDKLLIAHDRDELLRWLRHLPLMHSEGQHTMVHAGIPPMWSLDDAHGYAAEVEAALRGPEWRKFLSRMYGNTPRRWKSELESYPRLRTITNYLTRMRYLYANGTLDLVSKGKVPNPGRQVAPWFSYPGRETSGQTLLFGHWASIEGHTGASNIIALDTGCVWGRTLSAYCLESKQWTRCDCEH